MLALIFIFLLLDLPPQERLFPLSNMVSPVAQQLREVLKQFSWALDILGESVPQTVTQTMMSPSLSAHQGFLSSHSTGDRVSANSYRIPYHIIDLC